MGDMEKMVSASLCGLPLPKASLAIGVLHSILFGFLYFYELTWGFTDWIILFFPPGLTYLFYMAADIHTITCEAFLCVIAGVCLAVGAKKSSPGLILTWLVQQMVVIVSSLLTLSYFLVASYLKVPIQDCLFELCINGFQAYFLVVVYAHFQELRKGNLREDNDHLVNEVRP